MPATKIENININLIGGDEFSHAPIGRIITWATTYGRYIMILTEIIVLLAFISRFSLDRKLTDLKEEISQKQAIIETNSALEQNIRSLQQELQNLRTLMRDQRIPADAFTQAQEALPPDVFFESINASPKLIKLSITAGTTQGLSQFLVNLQANKNFLAIDLGDIKKQQSKGIQLDLSILLHPEEKKK